MTNKDNSVDSNSNYGFAIPNSKKQDIKSRIEAMKNKRNKTKLQKEENEN